MTTRQRSLLVAEDWKKIYQTFREADFQSYDFETLRKSMIDYIRLYYPEDFNDFIESSEYIALIDLIAFLGQGLAFRADLNSRENFIDTAERRESILRLARLINYSPKRNLPARGLLKVVSVRTTENLFDSDGIDLGGTVINWNDTSNDNWQEQFYTVINAALVSSQRIGRPGNTATINGVKTEEYQLNLPESALPYYQFNSTVEGINLPFEVVSSSTAGDVNLYETDPRPGSVFNVLQRNDRLGNNSVNTGFFVYFKQGTLGSQSLSFSDSIPNRVTNIAVPNINELDVWLFKLDSSGNPVEEWTRVPAITGSNIAYNSLSNVNRKIYQVVTRENDQVDLVFGDGVFAEIPQGEFLFYYRTSDGSAFKITTDELQVIPVSFRYVSKTGRLETLTLTASLQYTVANSAARESDDEIKQRAPQQYYTQNRIVTGEDYNIFPYTAYSTIIKAKAVNRTSSGISRFLDVVDVTGKYSSTNIYGDDGWLYFEESVDNFTFTFVNNNDIIKVLRDQLASVLKGGELINFYYEKFPEFKVESPEPTLYWKQVSKDANSSTGYFGNDNPLYPGDLSEMELTPATIGNFATGVRSYIRPGCLLRITAPAGYYFDSYGAIRPGAPSKNGDRLEIYASVSSVVDAGTNQGQGAFSDGTGPVTINQIIQPFKSSTNPDEYIYPTVDAVWAPYSSALPPALEQEILSRVNLKVEFGLRYDQQARSYVIIDTDDLAPEDQLFSLANQGQSNDSSWIVRFVYANQQYTVKYRQYVFVFESRRATRFYFDPEVRVFDPKTNTLITDNIKVLRTNPKLVASTNASVKTPVVSGFGLDQDYPLAVSGVFTAADGFRENNRIKVTYSDFDRDTIPDNISFFNNIVGPLQNSYGTALNRFVFFERGTDSFGSTIYVPLDDGVINSDYEYAFVTDIPDGPEHANDRAIELEQALYSLGQVFYATLDNRFYRLERDPVYTDTNILVQLVNDEYIVRTGRGQLYFQYRHNSPNNRRIDPSPNNLIDLYLLTSSYNDEYRAWIQDATGRLVEPAPPTSESLRTDYGGLEDYKPVSDALLYSSARFKPLFGSRADPALQAKFKVIKNVGTNVSDSEIRSRMIAAINDYFDVNNWDFGETFYFSELSSYLHQALANLISSIVLVPVSTDLQFGSLYQVNCEPDEIVISAATVDDIEIISAITASQLNQ